LFGASLANKLFNALFGHDDEALNGLKRNCCFALWPEFPEHALHEW